MPSELHGLVTHVDAVFVQKASNIAKWQREADVHHIRQAEDLWRGPEIAERVGICHRRTLRNRPARLKVNSPDNADRSNRANKKPVFPLCWNSETVWVGPSFGRSKLHSSGSERTWPVWTPNGLSSRQDAISAKALMTLGSMKFPLKLPSFGLLRQDSQPSAYLQKAAIDWNDLARDPTRRR